MPQLLDLLAAVLSEEPDLSAKELARKLLAKGYQNVDKSGINSLLYNNAGHFACTSDTPPRWRLKAAAAVPKSFTTAPLSPKPAIPGRRDADAAISRRAPQPTERIRLYAWQEDALAEWRSRGSRGIIEAVTGTGKTMLGIKATLDARARGGKVLVLVPTVELLHQWSACIKRYVPDVRLGLRGDGHQSDLKAADVVVSIVNSARAADVWATSPGGLLVADECHRYGSESNQSALDERFIERLGLSATHTRGDDGDENFLLPYFNGCCFKMGYKRAIDDNVVAHFKVALIGVKFSDGDQREYETQDAKVRKAYGALINQYRVPSKPYRDFMKEVTRLAKEGEDGAKKKARSYQCAFNARRTVLAETEAKYDALRFILPSIQRADRTIVFTETIDGALRGRAVLASCGLSSQAIHSQMDREERQTVFERFKAGELKVIVAPRVLDEGVDVPEADFAVILAASKTNRQMIQRMGRVLRRKPDGRLARFAIAFVEGTSEAPSSGAHETFLDQVTRVADAVEEFGSGGEAQVINSFLCDFASRAALRQPRFASAR